VKTPTGLSPRTVRYAHSVIRKALVDAVKRNRLARNAADAAGPPRSDLLGHYSAAFTLDTNSDSIPALHEGAAAAVARLVRDA
jgi:hypothetical protein